MKTNTNIHINCKLVFLSILSFDDVFWLQSNNTLWNSRSSRSLTKDTHTLGSKISSGLCCWLLDCISSFANVTLIVIQVHASNMVPHDCVALFVGSATRGTAGHGGAPPEC